LQEGGILQKEKKDFYRSLSTIIRNLMKSKKMKTDSGRREIGYYTKYSAELEKKGRIYCAIVVLKKKKKGLNMFVSKEEFIFSCLFYSFVGSAFAGSPKFIKTGSSLYLLKHSCKDCFSSSGKSDMFSNPIFSKL
jgi:hypothetical protein